MSSFRETHSKTGKIFLKVLARAKKLLAFFKKDGAGADEFRKNQARQIELDKKLVFSLAKSRLPSLKQLKYIGRYLSPKESWLLRGSIAVMAVSLLFIGARFYSGHLQMVPVEGGVYTEALVGYPKHINPIYATVNDVDSDISYLVYSSLFRRGREAELVRDLASEFSVSEDQKVYNIKLRPGVLWHDGTPLTARDVVFTFKAIKEPQYDSPMRLSFTGVEVEEVHDYEVKFTLSDPYGAFPELLTFGILPFGIWSEIPPDTARLSELNLKPIGSGPYKFKNYARGEKTGTIKEYNLERNAEYYGDKALVDISFLFYQSFEEAVAALNNDVADGMSYLPTELNDAILRPQVYNFHKLNLPQLTAIFFNDKNNEALGEKEVRQALAYAIDRQKIIDEVLGGGAILVDGPILPNSFAYSDEISKYGYDEGRAIELLEEAGYSLATVTQERIDELNEDGGEELGSDEQVELSLGPGRWRQNEDGEFLTIDLKSVNRNENREVLDHVKKYWEAIGVKTFVDILSVTMIQSEVIQPRDFGALFYGQIIGGDPDPYAFWHSSQAGATGFNISDYNNEEVDKLLEEARLSADREDRVAKYREFQKIISDETPAVFMYSSIYTYVQSKDVGGFDVRDILFPRDRFTNIDEWYMKLGKKLVW